MEGRAYRGCCSQHLCSCWGGCRFMRCLVPGRCSSCLRSSGPNDHAGAAAANAPAAAAPPAAANALALQQMPEITLAQLDAIIPLIADEVDRLDPAKSSSSSSQAPISQRLGDLLAQWEDKKQICTSFMSSLPKEITNEAAGNGKSLLMPLLTNALSSVGAVHWLGVGFAFIAWSLDSISSSIQNREDCIGILRRSLRLLRNTKEIWETTSSGTNNGSATNENLQDSVEKAFRCAVFCSANLMDAWILRFVKANSVKDAITILGRELDEAYLQNIAYTGARLLQSEAAKVERQVTFASTRDDIVGGQESVMGDALAFLQGSSDIIKVALLHGMGGIGKSTLAMEIFTEFQKSSTYRACRVELPLETRDEHLCAIQKQILEKVCKREFKFSNPIEGKRHMEKELPQINDPVFLYVDNAMEHKHLCQSLPQATFFPKASRILITSRSKYGTVDLDVLSRDFSYETFEVRKLQPEQARQLLWKQFESNGEHRDVSGVDISLEEERVLSLCDGLPLALIVVGKYILNEKGLENVGVWREVVKSMEEAEPLDGGKHDELYSRIKFSIQNLDGKAKAAFLDMVFFLDTQFIWEKISWERVERLVSPKYLKIFHQRALVQEGKESTGRPEIHDVLKKVGWRMAEEDKQELRIMGIDKLKEHDSVHLKQVVALHGHETKLVDVNLLRQMRSLRLLSRMCVMGECEEAVQLRELRVVQYLQGSMSSVNIDWSKCSNLKEVHWIGQSDDIFNFEVFRHDKLSKGLEALALQDWEQLKDVEVLETLTCLKELRLERCRGFERLPEGISRLTGLKQLALPGCSQLEGLPSGISALIGLQGLSLSHCASLQSLPDGLTGMTGLTKLDLGSCVALQSIPEGIGNLRALTDFNIQFCGSLESIPEGATSLMCGLNELLLYGCASIECLPEGITKLTGLKSLNLGKCANLRSLPEGSSGLTCLTKLSLHGCARFKSLPEGTTKLMGLQSLNLGQCVNLRFLPEGLSGLTGLKKLQLDGCARIECLPEGITKLRGLISIHLGRCVNLRSLPEGLSGLTCLTSLDLGGCRRLRALPELGGLTSLDSLSLCWCRSLQFLPNSLPGLSGLGLMPHLRWLDLAGSSLQFQSNLPNEISQLTSLVCLDLSLCKSLQSIEAVTTLTALQSLRVDGCSELQMLPEGLSQLTNLRDVCNLSQCRSLKSLPQSIGSFTRLAELDLTECTSLECLPDTIAKLSNLTRLCLLGCKSLQGLQQGIVSSLTRLQELKLGECAKLNIQPVLEEISCSMQDLRVLKLSKWEDLESLPEGMTTLTRLKEVSLSGCKNLKSLPQGMANWRNLKKLNLSGCRSLVSLPEELTTMTAISCLKLSGCAGLQALPKGIFKGLTALVQLGLAGVCAGLQIEELQEIPLRLARLEYLDLSESDHLLFLLNSQQGFAASSCLRELRLSGCRSLPSLPEGVTALKQLEDLNLSGCEGLQSLAHLPQGSKSRLRALDLAGCGGLDQPQVWDIIASLTSLRDLDLAGWESMRALPQQIANLERLEYLNLSKCSSLLSLPEGVTQLTRLEWLRLADCQSLRSLPPGITRLVKLWELDLRGCSTCLLEPDLPEEFTTGIVEYHRPCDETE